jgi:hypothetical protein
MLRYTPLRCKRDNCGKNTGMRARTSDLVRIFEAMIILFDPHMIRECAGDKYA